MMEEQRSNKDAKRIYFGGLFDCVSESEIRQRLCKYGEISNVQIVQRRDESGDILKTFAYVDINATTEAVNKCFSEYNKCRWKGKEIKIQLAKERYEKRLQREWQEVKSVQAEDPITSEIHKELYDKMEEAVLKTKHVTPGSKIKDKTNWVVGKYGRPLPVVYLRSKGAKVLKFDPSKHCHQLKKIKSLENEDENGQIGSLTWNIPGNKKIKKSKKTSFKAVENETENDQIENLTWNIQGNKKIKEAKRACKSSKTDNSLDALSEGDSSTFQESARGRLDQDSSISESGDADDKDEDSDVSMESSDAESIKDKEKLSDSIISQIRNSKDESKPIDATTKDTSVGSDCKKSVPDSEINFDDLRGNKSLMESFSKFLLSSKLPVENSNGSALLSIPKDDNRDDDKTDSVDSNDEEVVSNDSSASSSDEGSDSDEDENVPVIQNDKDTFINLFEVNSSTSSEDNEDLDMESDNEEDIIQGGEGPFKNGDSNDFEANSSSSSEYSEDEDDSNDFEANSASSSEGSEDEDDSNDFKANSASSSEGSEDEDDENDNENHKSHKEFPNCNSEMIELEAIKSSTDHKQANHSRLEKVVVSDKTLEIYPRSKELVKDSPKKKLSEEKRLDSLMEKSAKERKEKEIVQAALKNVDPQRNDQKHVKFGSFDDAECADSVPNEPGIAESNANASTEKIKGKAALSWLGLSSSEEEDSANDEGERFEIRPQFEGPTGQKLWKLQQRVGLDERFKLDERFLDDANAPKSLETEQMETVPENGDSPSLGDIEGERSRALSILDRLLGTKSSQKNLRKTPRENHSSDVYQEPVRYDPLNKEHLQYTIAEDLSNDSDDEEDDGKETGETENKEKPQPDVSKEAFFDVTPSLKNLFGNQTSSSFTFLSDPVAGSPVEDHPSVNDVIAPSVIKKPKLAKLSSDEEDNCDNYFEDTAKNTQSEKPESIPVSDYRRFFFTPSDPRLESNTVDGPAAFMRTLPLEELESFLEDTRENIRQNFKKKHKDSLRRRRKRDGNFAGLR